MERERLSSSARVAAARRSPFTYPEVGATSEAPLPQGYRHVHRRDVVGHAEPAFRVASDALMSWQVHRRAGLGVDAVSTTVEEGDSVVLRAGVAPLQVDAPCRVVYTINQEHRRGFAYGTLSGHPERGEAAFVLERVDHVLLFTVVAFSRPGAWYVRAARPLAHVVQDLVIARYFRALRRIAGETTDGADR